ncbi:MAG: RHS repeat-associated core domain-containing protein, partial [Phycisphaerae bacterium]
MVAQTSDEFTPPGTLVHGYNDRNELTGTTLASSDWRSYDYDAIGNRLEAVAYDSPTLTAEYNSNVLNQYENVLISGGAQPIPQGLVYDADGNMTEMFAVGDANCSGTVNNFDIDAFVAAVVYAEEETAPEDYTEAGGDQECWDRRHEWGDFTGDSEINNFDVDPFVAVLSGGGASGALVLRFEWDAENRLAKIDYPDACGSGAPNGFKRLTFAYDYMNRRIEKKVETCNTGTPAYTTTSQRRFVYDEWNLLLELDALNSNAVVRKYTWGLDLSGLNGFGASAGSSSTGFQPVGWGGTGVPPLSGLHSAGGIGGLLAVDVQSADPDTAESGGFWFTYDANGNVMQLLAGDSGYGGATADEWHDDRLVGRYEYDPYGNVANTLSAFALTNPMRFSTKYWDIESGFGDWGERYYDPRLGRWMNHDPMG